MREDYLKFLAERIGSYMSGSLIEMGLNGAFVIII